MAIYPLVNCCQYSSEMLLDLQMLIPLGSISWGSADSRGQLCAAELSAWRSWQGLRVGIPLPAVPWCQPHAVGVGRREPEPPACSWSLQRGTALLGTPHTSSWGWSAAGNASAAVFKEQQRLPAYLEAALMTKHDDSKYRMRKHCFQRRGGWENKQQKKTVTKSCFERSSISAAAQASLLQFFLGTSQQHCMLPVLIFGNSTFQ